MNKTSISWVLGPDGAPGKRKRDSAWMDAVARIAAKLTGEPCNPTVRQVLADLVPEDTRVREMPKGEPKP